MVFNEFHEMGIINVSMNSTFIALIPKTEGLISPKDFRPISLVSSVYMIISKVLFKRIRKVMGGITSISQGAFVKDKQILDEILIANECVEEMKIKGRKCVVCMVDLEKAYDNVNWDFLDYVMRLKGFGQRWRKWIWGCIYLVHFAILINGTSKGFFAAKKGLRQGDSLSPFLFTLVVDILSKLMTRAVERNLLRGFKVGNGWVTVSLLQLADDTILFL